MEVQILGDLFSKYLMLKISKTISLQKNARKWTYFRKELSLGYERSNQFSTSVQNILVLIGDIPQNYTRCGNFNYNSFSKSFHSFNAEMMLFWAIFESKVEILGWTWFCESEIDYINYRTKFSTRTLFIT